MVFGAVLRFRLVALSVPRPIRGERSVILGNGADARPVREEGRIVASTVKQKDGSVIPSPDAR